MSTSGFFETTVIGALRPPAQIEQWNVDGNNPFGFRHWESGNYRPDAKVGLVGGFQAQLESGRALNFGEAVALDGEFFTKTVAMTFNFGEVNLHNDSFFNEMKEANTVNTNFKAFNMKLWTGDMSAFTATGISIPTFHMRQSSGWLRGFNVTPGNPGVSVVPSSLPISGNIFSKTNQIFISGVYQDLEFSNFVYLRGQFASGTSPLGTYGGPGQGNFAFNFSYDWTDIDAAVLTTDTELCQS